MTFSTPRIVAVVQARMTSSRLPGKPLLKIGKKIMLHMMLDRIRKSTTLSDIVVATSALPENDVIAKECKRLAVRCFRGSENDVLSRFVAITRQTGADHIVRICGDEPFVDADIIDRVVRSHVASRAAYTSTALERTFPKGADVEVVTREALLACDMLARSPREREHVTLRLVTDARFRKNNVVAPRQLRMPELNICVDTAQDLRFIRKLQDGVGFAASTEDVVAFARQHPEIRRRPLVVFRADGGWKRGMGHFSTGLALCRCLQNVGMDVVFLVRGDPVAIRVVQEAGFALQQVKAGLRTEAPEVLAVLAHLRPELYITDLVTIPKDYAPALRALHIRTLSLDVLGTMRFTPDVVVNRSLVPARINRYNRTDTVTKRYLGPKYFILDEAFARMHAHKKRLQFPPQQVVLTFGGSDPKNLTVKALRAVDRVSSDCKVTVIIGAAYKHQRQLERVVQHMAKPVRVLKNIANMAEVLHAADLAVAAGGHTLAELACTGTPAIILSLEPEQLVNAKEFEGYGTMVNAGWGPDISVTGLVRAIERVMQDRAGLECMSRNGQKVVDGYGLERVVRVVRVLLR